MSSIDLKNLLDQYFAETISREDYRLLWETLDNPEYAAYWHEAAAEIWGNENLHPIIDPQKQVVLDRVKRIVESERIRQSVAPVHRVHFLRKWGLRVASVILLLGAGAYLWSIANKEKKSTVAISESRDVLPGRSGAVLTLADGSSLLLDTARDGVLALQGGTVARVIDGTLLYEGKGTETVYNTLSTPKGRMFHLTLSDGTKVWLNSESSIRYPAFFAGKERKIEITGEAFFEVAAKKDAPFRLSIENKLEVEVLGTAFNVNAYENEKSINTTLIEGAVRVSARKVVTRFGSPENSYLTLKPGQQAQVTGNSLRLIENPDIEKVTAWKTGLFNFEDAPLDEVMRQLERWYDIEVIYEKGIPDIRFFGKVSRNLTLADLLRALEDSKVSFRMEEGKKLIVFP